MKLGYKITIGIILFLTIVLSVLALVLSHTSDCPPPVTTFDNTQKMKSNIYRCYGSPDVIEYADINKPVPEKNEVLVKIKAASVNPLDWHYMRGSPYLMRLAAGIGSPNRSAMGVDFSGIVEVVGQDVKRFKPGDEVFGGKNGAFSEYITVRDDQALVMKPAYISFQQAASVPIAGITALQALRDKGNIKPGQKVLINGASGGVGTFAVQIAKSFGADVTGVCSTRNVAMVLAIGADKVIDYRQQNYTEGSEKYDLIIDTVGNHSLLTNRQVLKPNGILVLVGGAKGDWITPMVGPINALVLSPFVSQEFKLILARLTIDDLDILANLMQEGKINPVIEKRYKLSEVADAIRHSEKGHARGKLVIDVQ